MNLVPNFIRRAIVGVFKSGEGSYRGPAIGWSNWGNPFSIELGDGFQAGLNIRLDNASAVPSAYAGVMAYAKAVSQCYAKHVRIDAAGKHTTVTTSPLSRVLRKPNSYQTWPQFMLNVIATELFIGEAFVLLVRDDRFAITAMHLLSPRTCSPYVEYASGEIFYSVGANPMIPAGIDYMVPARDMMHLRQYTPRHPLIGETPLTAAALAMGINVALSGNQAAFFAQMSRPSGIISTEQALTRDQMNALRTAFDEQSKEMNAGKIPILGNGLKFQPLGISSQDSQLMQAQRMSIEEIARVLGVPLPIIGDLSSATLNNTESIINFWLATGLGSILENTEKSFDAAFNLGPDEYVELDTVALLRMSYETRVTGLTKSVQGGLMTPNEARSRESLPPKEGGDDLYLQRQMTSVALLGELQQAEIDAKPTPTDPADPTDPGADPTEEVKAMVEKELRGIKYVH